jgi:hypothetical protein
MQTTVNGWSITMKCGVPGNDILLRAACAQIFPGPVNVPQEAMYWRTRVDGAGHKLNGQQDYILHYRGAGLEGTGARRHDADIFA